MKLLLAMGGDLNILKFNNQHFQSFEFEELSNNFKIQ